jgi:hypothetical protein
VAAAPLRVNQRLFDVVDPVGRLDRCAQQPVANFGGEIGNGSA